MKIGAQRPAGVQADFVEQAGDIEHPAGFVVGAARHGGGKHGGVRKASPAVRKWRVGFFFLLPAGLSSASFPKAQTKTVAGGASSCETAMPIAWTIHLPPNTRASGSKPVGVVFCCLPATRRGARPMRTMSCRTPSWKAGGVTATLL